MIGVNSFTTGSEQGGSAAASASRQSPTSASATTRLCSSGRPIRSAIRVLRSRLSRGIDSWTVTLRM